MLPRKVSSNDHYSACVLLNQKSFIRGVITIIEIWEERKSRLYGDDACAHQPRPWTTNTHRHAMNSSDKALFVLGTELWEEHFESLLALVKVTGKHLPN